MPQPGSGVGGWLGWAVAVLSALTVLGAGVRLLGWASQPVQSMVGARLNTFPVAGRVAAAVLAVIAGALGLWWVLRYGVTVSGSGSAVVNGAASVAAATLAGVVLAAAGRFLIGVARKGGGPELVAGHGTAGGVNGGRRGASGVAGVVGAVLVGGAGLLLLTGWITPRWAPIITGADVPSAVAAIVGALLIAAAATALWWQGLTRVWRWASTPTDPASTSTPISRTAAAGAVLFIVAFSGAVFGVGVPVAPVGAQPCPPQGCGGGGNSGGNGPLGQGGSEFRPPPPSMDPQFGVPPSYPGLDQAGGVSIYNPSGQPGSETGYPSAPQSSGSPGSRIPVHGQQPPNYDLPVPTSSGGTGNTTPAGPPSAEPPVAATGEPGPASPPTQQGPAPAPQLTELQQQQLAAQERQLAEHQAQIDQLRGQLTELQQRAPQMTPPPPATAGGGEPAQGAPAASDAPEGSDPVGMLTALAGAALGLASRRKTAKQTPPRGGGGGGGGGNRTTSTNQRRTAQPTQHRGGGSSGSSPAGDDQGAPDAEQQSRATPTDPSQPTNPESNATTTQTADPVDQTTNPDSNWDIGPGPQPGGQPWDLPVPQTPPVTEPESPRIPVPETPWEYNNGYTTTVDARGPDGKLIDGGSLVSLDDVWNELHRCFNCNFPIGGAPKEFPKVGDNLPLEMKFAGVKAANLPVTVTQINRTADAIDIEFAALPGHTDGPGSTIHFRWTEQGGAPRLDIRGYITEGPGSDGPWAAPARVGYTALAEVVWQPYIDNVVTHVVQAKGYEAVPLAIPGGR